MLISDYILARLAKEGVDTAFLVYGGAMAELADALARQNAIRYVCAQHEQAAGFMAEGYAKAKGVPGLVIVTSGPGGGNIVTCLQNAYFDSVPLIALTGQVSSNLVKPKESPARQLGFQECDIVSVAKPITKYAVMAEGPLHAVNALETCILESCGGRPGPVLLDIPSDIQRATVAQDTIPEFKLKVHASDVKNAALGFLSALASASRPGILVGGGAYKARDEICAFAAAHKIPVFRTWNALDVVTDDCEVYGGTVGTYGGPGRNFGVQNCDLLLILGCRISGRITGGMPHTFARGARKWIVNLDEAACDPRWQEVKGEVNVLADCAEFMHALA